MEVMGLMLGEFVDEYTVRVIDVFAMPQSGTGVSVEAVDPVFQAKMLDMLKQTGIIYYLPNLNLNINLVWTYAFLSILRPDLIVYNGFEFPLYDF